MDNYDIALEKNPEAFVHLLLTHTDVLKIAVTVLHCGI